MLFCPAICSFPILGFWPRAILISLHLRVQFKNVAAEGGYAPIKWHPQAVCNILRSHPICFSFDSTSFLEYKGLTSA
jgi:hypothetical protein